MLQKKCQKQYADKTCVMYAIIAVLFFGDFPVCADSVALLF